MQAEKKEEGIQQSITVIMKLASFYKMNELEIASKLVS